MVGKSNRQRQREHGNKIRNIHRPNPPRPGPARNKMPRPGIPAHNLRTGIRPLQNIEKLRRRSTAARQSLAIKEFVLGIEALPRFVNREPLHRIRQCTCAVLVLESKLADPRL